MDVDDDEVYYAAAHAQSEHGERFKARLSGVVADHGALIVAAFTPGRIGLDGEFSPDELEAIARIWRETENE